MEQVKIPIGYAFFSKSKYNTPTLQRYLTMKRKSILYTQQKWKIYEEEYCKRWRDIWMAMVQALVFEIDLSSNNQSCVLLMIAHVDFSRLKSMNVQNNNLKFIAVFCKMSLPYIEELYLGNNKITSLQIFRKINLPNLQKLDLHNNQIQEMQWISELNTKKLNKILLEWQDSKVIGQNISWFAKLSCLTFKYLRIQSISRIRQRKVDEKVCNKYDGVQLWRSK